MSENGYTSRLLKRLLREVQRSSDKRGRDNERQRERGDKGQRQEAMDGFLTLPYVDERLLRKIKHREKI